MTAVAVSERQELVQKPVGETVDARLNRVDADLLEVLQADFNGGDTQVVERPVLEARLAGDKGVSK